MLGENLKRARRNAGLTQDDVAKYLNIIRQTYSAYETGRSTPNPETLNMLACIFEVSVDWLLGNTSDPTPHDKKEKAPSAETEREKDLKYISEKIRELEINDLIKVDDYIDLLIHRHNK